MKLYLLEADSAEVQELVSSQSDPLPIWELQKMELTNALRLKIFWGEISPADANWQLDRFVISCEIPNAAHPCLFSNKFQP